MIKRLLSFILKPPVMVQHPNVPPAPEPYAQQAVHLGVASVILSQDASLADRAAFVAIPLIVQEVAKAGAREGAQQTSDALDVREVSS